MMKFCASSLCLTLSAALGCGDDGGREASTTVAASGVTMGTLSTSPGVTADPTTGGGETGEPTSTGGMTGGPEPTTTSSTTTVGGACGDGVVDAGESCDAGPGNGPNGGCSAMCTINPSSCGMQKFEASLEVSPVDIIIVIDNSGSMGQEIEGVQNNINSNFASIIEASGLDYRVILVSQFGDLGEENVCIEAPLSGTPPGGCGNPQMPVNNPGKFYHYSETIASTNAWCKLLDTFDTPDNNDFAPTGWQEWLRPEAFKSFIVLTDDRAECGDYADNNSADGGAAAAAQFDADLLALSPLHFGTAEARNYAWYSIVAMAYNNPMTAPYLPQDPVVTGECPTASSPGTGHQAMSILTDALRFPLCDTTAYDVVFQAIADGVVKGAKIACSFPMPEPPPGESIDLDSVTIEYTSGGGLPTVFTKVDGPGACGPQSFYIVGDVATLCPQACALVQADPNATIDLAFECPPLPPG